MNTTVPRRFESLLERDPYSPAVVLIRPGARDRVWVRAAVEHRAVRIAGVCSLLGLASQARVAFSGHGALDRMAAAWFVLATGRVLVEGTDADFEIDDALCRQSEIRTEPYSLRCTVQTSDPAVAMPTPHSHRELLRMLMSGRAPESDLGLALQALALGEPLLLHAAPDADPRALVYAA
jgi:hypothetical protein